MNIHFRIVRTALLGISGPVICKPGGSDIPNNIMYFKTNSLKTEYCFFQDLKTTSVVVYDFPLIQTTTQQRLLASLVASTHFRKSNMFLQFDIFRGHP